MRSKFKDLDNLIGELNDKVTLVANAQESEFLSAYRVHMLSVQLELKDLKSKVDAAELSLQGSNSF